MIVDLYYPRYGFTYKVDIWKDEYIEYLWEKETGTSFHPLSYFLEPLGKEIYSKLEKEWANNKLPLYDIRQEKEFYNFLLDRFEDKAENAYWKSEEERQAEEDYLRGFQLERGEEPCRTAPLLCAGGQRKDSGQD